MRFDGSDINVGDTVFDTAYGQGRVVELRPSEDAFSVVFPNGRHQSYSALGAGITGQKSLYWSYPVAFIPPKGAENSPNWAKFQRLVDALAKELL
jgi:hypothetical protein